MNPLRIALAQTSGTVGDLAGNSARIEEYLEEARRGGAHLVVFPQFALEGWPSGDLLLSQAFLADARSAWPALAERTSGITAIIGAVECDAEPPAADAPGAHLPGSGAPRTATPCYNAAVIMHDGASLRACRKQSLETGSPLLDETRYFQPGGGCRILQVAGWRVGVVIGSDIEPETGVVERLVGDGAELIVNLDARPFRQGAWQDRERELADVARRYGVYVAYINRVGGQDEFVFDGGSMVLAPDGGTMAWARPFHDDLLICDLHPPGAPAGAVPHPQPPQYDDLAATYQALTVGIRDYAGKNGFRHLVLGLSGGIDSALVATLAADALGPDALTAVWLPSPYSSELSRKDAFELADALGIKLVTIPIETPMQAFQSALQPIFGDRAPDVTEENLQARIRGSLLMALSNKFGWLLLSTSNKSETAVGYSTLYGDMAGGLAPLRDVYKTLVFELARWRNRQGRVIPESTISRAPTAELRPDQLDTDSLPDYDILDPVLRRYLEEGRGAEELIAAGADPDLVARVIGLVGRGEFKRRQGPPGIKITPYTFGIDDRMPMTSRFREV